MTDPNLPPQGPPASQPGAQPPVNQPPAGYPAGVAYPQQYPAPQVSYGTPPPQQFAYPATGGGMSRGLKIGLFVGGGCLLLLLIGVLVVAIVVSAMFASIGNSIAESETYTSDEGFDSGDEYTAPDDTETLSLEDQYKSGDDWLPAPADTEAQPGAFLPGYQTAEEWLATVTTLDPDFDVVFTSDPIYNCGLSKAPKDPDWVVGCYRPEYGRTLFLWWGANAIDDMKKLILLHEYSHFYQNWSEFDATTSADQAGLFDDAGFRQDVFETDATCRVYRDWGFSNLEYLDSYTVSPCGATVWYDDWYEEQIEAEGVTVEDW